MDVGVPRADCHAAGGAVTRILCYTSQISLGRWWPWLLRIVIASSCGGRKFCIAPVRSDIPAPPLRGIERRRKERMILELGGICLGLIEQRFAHEPAAPPQA